MKRKIKKIIKIKININSPLVKINRPEAKEKINIFFWTGFFNIRIKNFKNSMEKTICKLIEEICPQLFYPIVFLLIVEIMKRI